MVRHFGIFFLAKLLFSPPGVLDADYGLVIATACN